MSGFVPESGSHTDIQFVSWVFDYDSFLISAHHTGASTPDFLLMKNLASHLQSKLTKHRGVGILTQLGRKQNCPHLKIPKENSQRELLSFP